MNRRLDGDPGQADGRQSSGIERRRGDRREADRRDQDRRAENLGRAPLVVAFGLMWLAITGYYIGLTSPMAAPEKEPSPLVAAENDTVDDNGQYVVIPATSYDGMATQRKSPNDRWTTELGMLKQTTLDVTKIPPRNAEQRLESLRRRSELRAFAGAPPLVPHSIDQMSSRVCMACHEKGLQTESLRAARMSHAYLTNCTQCHVERYSTADDGRLFASNSFIGVAERELGHRANPQAPPALPHPTWMRSNCLSCHGELARPGIQTTHPWRQNCLQCHASLPGNDQQPLPSSGLLPPLKIVTPDDRPGAEPADTAEPTDTP